MKSINKKEQFMNNVELLYEYQVKVIEFGSDFTKTLGLFIYYKGKEVAIANYHCNKEDKTYSAGITYQLFTPSITRVYFYFLEYFHNDMVRVCNGKQENIFQEDKK